MRIAAAGFLASRRPRRRPSVESRKTTHGPVHTAHRTPARAARGPLSRQTRPSPSPSQKPPHRPRLASHQPQKNRHPFLGLPGHSVSISANFFPRNFTSSYFFICPHSRRASRCSLSQPCCLSRPSRPHASATPRRILRASSRRGAAPDRASARSDRRLASRRASPAPPSSRRRRGLTLAGSAPDLLYVRPARDHLPLRPARSRRAAAAARHARRRGARAAAVARGEPRGAAVDDRPARGGAAAHPAADPPARGHPPPTGRHLPHERSRKLR